MQSYGSRHLYYGTPIGAPSMVESTDILHKEQNLGFSATQERELLTIRL